MGQKFRHEIRHERGSHTVTLKTKDIVDKFADLPGEQRQGLVAAAGPDPGGHRCRRGGYAGEPEAVMLLERVSKLGGVAGNAG